jgi:hypothetical protein
VPRCRANASSYTTTSPALVPFHLVLISKAIDAQPAYPGADAITSRRWDVERYLATVRAELDTLRAEHEAELDQQDPARVARRNPQAERVAPPPKPIKPDPIPVPGPDASSDDWARFASEIARRA